MGVQGLYTYLKQKRDELVKVCDLVNIARTTPGGLKILVDFYSWEHYIKSSFERALTGATHNGNILFDGGEYDLLDALIKSFVEELRSVNIELEFFLDGAKGSSYQASKQKWSTWTTRHLNDQQRLKESMAYLRGQIPLSELDLDHLTRPVLQEVQNILTLQEIGCKLHQCVSGEADQIIARRLRIDENAFCVFSNDSDFCIFPGSSFLSHELFDMDNDMGLQSGSLVAKKPQKLMCGIVTSEDVRRILNLPSDQSLIELAIIGGNDFTAPFLRSVREHRDIRGKIEMQANLIRNFGVAEHCPVIGSLIMTNPGMGEAVSHSRKFYNVYLEDEEESQTGYIFNLIADNVRKCAFPSCIVSMHRGFYWHRQVLEDCDLGLPTAEGSMAPFRAYVYAILLPRQKQWVSEHGRTPNRLLEEVKVMKVPDSSIPTLAMTSKHSFIRRLQLFEYIVSHQEIENSQPKSFIKSYGIKMGFLCYLLRYFLLQNWHRNLFISQGEFFVVAAWILARHDSSAHRELSIVPSPRCVTVESWFLCLYRNAYAFLGNVLLLSHEFPKPKEVFSGATFVALYTGSAVNEPDLRYREPPPRSVPLPSLLELEQTVRSIIYDKRHILRHIIGDVFPFS